MKLTQTTRCNTKRYLMTLTLLTVAVIASGCKTYTDYGAFLTEPRPLVTLTDYLLEPPDVITITSKRVREIDGHTETIRPDGKITLPLVGSIFVAGRTCEEVSAEIQGLAREYYDDADVSLRVRVFASKKIFVFGEVGAPGPYRYDGSNTILETLAAAQPSRLADPARILILRPDRDGGEAQRMTININDMIRKGDTTLNAVLEEGDIIYVPANALAAIGLGLQQILLPIQPAAKTVTGPGDIEEDVAGTTYGRRTAP